ncbi:MAG: aconitate hydratase AcnA [Actinomycetota bacterium]|nr:aconitate hydratase AcnA [Actinomycetota bacterium]
MSTDDFEAGLGTRSTLAIKGDASQDSVAYFSLPKLAESTATDLDLLPHTVKILLENLLRRAGGRDVSEADVRSLATWPAADPQASLAFMPGRVLMQDFTGVPAVVDLAALRSAISRAGGDPNSVNPFVPVDLIIDHSVMVDRFGTPDAYRSNIDWEYRRNAERYALLRWAQQAFDGFRVVPPGMGICHQVNLEYLGRVVTILEGVASPDTLVGTDSHTTMINGLGVLGWGVGGIEAEAAMLGQPMFLTRPVVVGVRTVGELPTGTTATDLVLTFTQMLRSHGVVGRFVEFFGDGLSTLSIADRATLSNMSPEFGATATLFPCDNNTLRYLKDTGRADVIQLVETYTKEQRLFRADGDPEPTFSEVIDLDLSSVEPSLAGPRRPQDRVSLGDVWGSFEEAFDGITATANNKELSRLVAEGGNPEGEDPEAAVASNEVPAPTGPPDVAGYVGNGSVVIAAITSCTNTSNPSVMIAAGLLAKKAIEAGLTTQPWVKTSLAPGSRVVTDYLEKAGLLVYLDKLGFNLVGYGCTTCIGNSGAHLANEDITSRVDSEDLAVVAVLSGNRNFEGRIHPLVKASYLASPPLCVAYALAGTVEIDLTKDPLGTSPQGDEVFLADIWPTSQEIAELVASSISSDQFTHEYGRIFEGDEHWQEMAAPTGRLYEWDSGSTYVQEPPYFTQTTIEFQPPGDINDARVLVLLGDSVTTDHISPAGSIKVDSPAGRYLQEKQVEPQDFNSFGSRRGNHEVMMRGTFGNIRLRNRMAPGTEGPWTQHLPDGETMSIYDAALRYQAAKVPTIVIAGKEYGSGSSRDWAAKGTSLLGVKAVIAQTYERIHRSNLVGMGVLPLQFSPGDSAEALGLSGEELFTIKGISTNIRPMQSMRVTAVKKDGSSIDFDCTARIDAPAEVDYYLNGGILQMVLRDLLTDSNGRTD